MNKSYFVAVHEAKDHFWCQFIDISNCVVKGENKDIGELAATASLVCSEIVEEMMKNGETIPEPCAFASATKAARKVRMNRSAYLVQSALSAER